MTLFFIYYFLAIIETLKGKKKLIFCKENKAKEKNFFPKKSTLIKWIIRTLTWALKT